jgi:metallo-beta-lactamase family protein
LFATPATVDISPIMLDDTSNILAGSETGKEYNLDKIYAQAVVERVNRLWHKVPYETKHRIADDLSVTFYDAGHVLGSASALVEIDNGPTVLFTGDLGNSPSPLLRDTQVPSVTPDYVVIESVYGDRNHEHRDVRRQTLKRALLDTLEHDKVMLMPTFSLERTQELLYEINELVESGEVSSMPIFLDSPLALKLTDVFYEHKNEFKEEVRNDIASGDDIFMFKGLKKTMETKDSKAILRVPGPKVIIAGAGMSSGGRILHHHRNYLGHPNTLVLITGYQTPGTLGRELSEGAKEVTIFEEKIPVRAEVRMLRGYSGHKDSDHLIEYVSKLGKGIRKVFVAMGERRSSMFLAQRIKDYLGIHAYVPEKNEIVDIM